VSAPAKAEHRRYRSVAFAIATSLLVITTAVGAQNNSTSDVKSPARVAYERAENAAAEMHFADALAAYEQAATLDPSAPFIRVARARSADLRAHAEGNFVPLTRLEKVRRNPSATRDEIDALSRDAAQFPPGRVRAEAQLVAAEAFWHRFGAPDLATRALEQALEDPSADRLTRALALSELVALERERERLDRAATWVARYPDLAPNLTAEIRRLERRVWLGRSAWIGFSGLMILGGIGALRAIWRQRRDPEKTIRGIVRPSSVAFALYIGGVASILVRLHGEGDVRPFLWLGFGGLAVDVAARGWRAGFVDERMFVRMTRAFASVIAIFAVAFLALQYADAVYLETIGL
jgi:tetratricopeptide (TPR) repeat protein